MNKSNVTRRKFLAGLGVTAGAAAVVPAFKTMNALASTRSHSALTSTKSSTVKKPTFLAKFHTLQPVKTISRSPGTSRLPLAIRPV